ncbi:MAG: acyl-CoA dehydrogenase [Pseudomonadota bacterium]
MSKRNLRFTLFEALNIQEITQYERFATHNRKMFDLVLDEALRMGKDLIWPACEEMDAIPPHLENGKVRVHPVVARFMAESGEGGWIGAPFPEEHGGQELPITLAMACQFIFSAANYSAAVFPELSTGAAHLILSFGSPELAETYLPPMMAGKWQGTMALTEPDAGSSLSDITTEAVDSGQGYYRIRGRKIFISAGDHDAVENVVHLMLAKIPGGPPGVKGISLFVVPKLRPEGGKLVENDLICTQVYHKMGYRGTPLTELAIGDHDNCRGFLEGEPHRGLVHMFQMMNEARLGVGMGATGIASAAYCQALEYTRSRTQSRKMGNRDPLSPPVPIIEHADIRRMLLFQRSVVEGALSLILQCCRYSDLVSVTQGEEKERYHLLLEILTPVAKTFPSEMGVLATSAAIQCLGGYGYCDDFPVERYFRDMRIHPIHEGTTGIQGMDLLGRKVVMQEGKALSLFAETLAADAKKAEEFPETCQSGERLVLAMKRVEEVILHLVGVAGEKGAEAYLADAALFLEMFGQVAVAWQWLISGMAAARGLAVAKSKADRNFYQGKLLTMRYFFAYELPKIEGLATRLTDGEALTVDMETAWFED